MDLEAAAQQEWLEVDGIGGWASSSVSGANTRRYHGLLVVASNPPDRRLVILSRLETTLLLGESSYQLGCNEFEAAVTTPDCDVEFSQDPFPTWLYRVGDITLEKSVLALHGHPAVLIGYRLIGADSAAKLRLTPLLAGRDYHQLLRAEGSVPDCRFRDGVLSTAPLIDGLAVRICAPGADFTPGPDWWYGFLYRRELERGFDHVEDLWTPGQLSLTLSPEHPVQLLVTTDPELDAFAVGTLLEAESRRRHRATVPASSSDRISALLTHAADQFLIKQPNGSDAVIAGYHWFGSWGRDTLISLPGLTQATGRTELSRAILLEWSRWFSEGMLPNRFAEAGEQPEYNSVDAALWFFVALHAHWRHTGDRRLLEQLVPQLRDVIAWHRRGTRHGIRVDKDGLLAASEPGLALTWMDARVDGIPVTPRHGKAVEICALWINALRILADFEAVLGDSSAAQELNREARRAGRNFSRLFWNGARSCLYDVITDDGPDSALRPNQLLALSLPYPLLSQRRRQQVLRTVERTLLTPVGLRTLAPDDPAYCPQYRGDATTRDSAYHQGTVWPWLLGPYVDALVLVRDQQGCRQGRRLLEEAVDRLYGVVATHSIGEVCDGAPPHTPGGAIAQAWSVAELLRAWRMVNQEMGDSIVAA